MTSPLTWTSKMYIVPGAFRTPGTAFLFSIMSTPAEGGTAMLTYHLEDRGDLPLYDFLYRRIRQDILDGTLRAGERLPSKRALAEHLQVSVITVEGAYRQLEAEGYLTASPRRGFFVNRLDRLPAPLAPAPIRQEPAEPAWRLDLGRNRTDPARFPAAAWARLTRQVLSEGNFLSPVPHQGLYALRQAISRTLRDLKGMAAAPEQIVVSAGAEHLYLLLAQLLGPGTRLAVEDPGYPKIRQVYGKCGLTCLPVPLDRQGMDPRALRASRAAVAHLSPAHHYPTGLVTPIARRQALLRWAEETGGVLIEDDYDSEFRFTGRPLPTLQSIDGGGRVIYLNTFSQTIAPAIRVGFMVLPPRLLARYQSELGFYACAVPVPDQYVLEKFLSGGHYEQHLARMRKEYRTRRAAVLDAFRRAPFTRSIRDQGAGLHFLLELNTARGVEELRRRAADREVRLAFLSDYAAEPERDRDRTLVVNYAGLDPSRLEETVELLAEIFLG